VFSRFRLAGVLVILGVAMVGALFYGLINSHYLSNILGRTLGPYSDALSQHMFQNRDPELWRQMAMRHAVGILVETPGEEPVGFDTEGRPLNPDTARRGQVRAVRTGPDGTRITFFWTLGYFREGHLPLVVGLLVMVVGVVVAAFWFLHLQLKPLAWLQDGVDAVARGDFRARVPVVRNDEIGHVAEAFNDMAGRVGEMIDDRERLLADVSHELRSPIARMKVALEFMPEGEKREALARDLREMENLIAVLLEREELRSRTGRLEGRDFDLAELVGEVVAAFAGRAPGVELDASGPVQIHADPELIKLLIQNLVDNAVKFSREDSKPVMVRLESGRDEVVLRVLDDGIGIPPGSETKLFEPFVKSSRARGHHVGYGIGLNLCQRIVQLHGGEIRLRPREANGTEAIVALLRRPR
jgi:signal transduction histidine kinase